MLNRVGTRLRVTIAACMAVTLALVGAVGCGGDTGTPEADGNEGGAEGATIVMVPKTISDPYFQAAFEGAEEAADELGVTVELAGPAQADASEQAQIIDQTIQQQPDAITVSANDPDALVPSLGRAQEGGIATSTFDADVAPAGRELFMNQSTFEGIAETITEEMVEATGGEGDILVVTAQLTAPNQNRWIEEIKAYMADNHPDMKVSHVAPANADQERARALTKSWLQANPETAGVITVDGNAQPGAAQAIEELGLDGEMPLTGIGVPSLSGKDIHEGTVKSAVLWNPTDIGYATVYMVYGQLDGTVEPGDDVLEAGRLGELEFISEDTILLGDPVVFTKENVDDFDF